MVPDKGPLFVCLSGVLIPQNQACCGEMQITKDTRVRIINPGLKTKSDATEKGAIVLPRKPNLTELTGVMAGGVPRSFYISFGRLGDQKQFMQVVQNNIRQLILASGEPVLV